MKLRSLAPPLEGCQACFCMDALAVAKIGLVELRKGHRNINCVKVFGGFY